MELDNFTTKAIGEGARASCHGIIKVAKVAAVAHGVKAAVRVEAHGVRVVVNRLKMWMH